MCCPCPQGPSTVVKEISHTHKQVPCELESSVLCEKCQISLCKETEEGVTYSRQKHPGSLFGVDAILIQQ